MPRKSNPLSYLVEPLEEEPSFIQKPMFGCQACYLFGKLQVVLASGDAPWNGLLVATDRKYHAALIEEFPALLQHPVLGKWLYLAEDQDCFDQIAAQIIRKVAQGDARIGVEPQKKRRKKRTTTQR